MGTTWALQQLAAMTEVPATVVMEMGTNPSPTADIGPVAGRLTELGAENIIWLSAHSLNGDYAAWNASLTAGQANGGYTIANWAREAAAHPEWYAADRLHHTQAGQDAFAQFIAAQIPNITYSSGGRALQVILNSTTRNPNAFGIADAATPSAQLNVNDYYGPRSAHIPNLNLGGNDRLFRIECDFSHFAYDDSIVFPGQQGRAHLHMFFGNTFSNADSTYDSLLNSGASTCNGGALNRSSYWIPAVFNRQGQAQVPSYFVAYYKTLSWQGNYRHIDEYPEGLKMITGNQLANQPQDAASNLRSIEMSCDIDVRGGSGRYNTNSNLFPRCAAGQASGANVNSIKMQIRFPFCWNGRDLYQPDQSHVSFPNATFTSTDCPASHPIVMPSVEFLIFFDIPPGEDTSTWYVSSDVNLDGSIKPGGTTLHADWFGAWHRDTVNMWVDNCSNVAGAHCAQGLLGPQNHHPALVRLQPGFGPYSRYLSYSPAELVGLCPGKTLDSRPQMIALCHGTRVEPEPEPRLEEAEADPPLRSAVQPDTTAPNASIGAYDTAWEMAYKATNAEIVDYLDHLQASGFDGTWLNVLPFGAGYDARPPDTGDKIATNANGQVTLTPAYQQRISNILDLAAQRNLKVGLVLAWARANTCNNQNIGPANGHAFAANAARKWANKPALEYWILGGDVAASECGGTRLLDTSRALAQGLTDSGARQQIAFHTGAGQANYLTFNNEPWLDVQAVQTGHCQDAQTMGAKIRSTVNQSTKPVILAESRYYRLAPPWNGCLHNPSNPVDHTEIAADVNAGRQAGVIAALFGDGLRYQWCQDKTGVTDDNYQCTSIASTFNTPGEQAFLQTTQ